MSFERSLHNRLGENNTQSENNCKRTEIIGFGKRQKTQEKAGQHRIAIRSHVKSTLKRALIVSTLFTIFSSPAFAQGTTSNGTLNYPNSGTGNHHGSVGLLDWSTSSIGTTNELHDGDVVNFDLPGCRAGTLTARFSNVVVRQSNFDVRDMNTWVGAPAHRNYNGPGLGEAFHTQDRDMSFTIDWSMTVNGVNRDPDIFFFDAEASKLGDREDTTAVTNGGPWQVIENIEGSGYTVSGIGTTTVVLDGTFLPTHIPLLLSQGTTQTSVSMVRPDRGSAVAFGLLLPCDFGDAPGYGDPVHAYWEQDNPSGLGLVPEVGELYLGSLIDSETGTQAQANADGDDNDLLGGDEDGATLPNLIQGETATIPVSVSGAGGYLQAWIDFAGDGNFTTAGDQIAINVQDGGAGDSDGAANGVISLSVDVPISATTNQTYARFRWASVLSLDSVSAAPDGEVEDYALTVQTPPPPPLPPLNPVAPTIGTEVCSAPVTPATVSSSSVSFTGINNAGGVFSTNTSNENIVPVHVGSAVTVVGGSGADDEVLSRNGSAFQFSNPGSTEAGASIATALSFEDPINLRLFTGPAFGGSVSAMDQDHDRLTFTATGATPGFSWNVNGFEAPETNVVISNGGLTATVTASVRSSPRDFAEFDISTNGQLTGLIMQRDSIVATGFNNARFNIQVPPCLEKELGVAKSASTPVVNADGTFDVTYTVVLQNTGDTRLDNIQLDDDLTATFGSTYTASNETDTSGGVISGPQVTLTNNASGNAVAPTPNTSTYDGASIATLFAGNDGILDPGDEITVTFTARANPLVSGAPATFDNSAEATAQDPEGDTATDLSDSGSDPTNNSGDDTNNTPTTVTSPVISADLSLTKTNTPGVNGEVDQAADELVSGSTTTYTVTVTNNGPVTVTGAVVTDTIGAGLTCTGTDPVNLSGDGVPAGSFTISDLTGAGITLATLTDGQSTTITYSCEVN